MCTIKPRHIFKKSKAVMTTKFWRSTLKACHIHVVVTKDRTPLCQLQYPQEKCLIRWALIWRMLPRIQTNIQVLFGLGHATPPPSHPATGLLTCVKHTLWWKHLKDYLNVCWVCRVESVSKVLWIESFILFACVQLTHSGCRDIFVGSLKYQSFPLLPYCFCGCVSEVVLASCFPSFVYVS